MLLGIYLKNSPITQLASVAEFNADTCYKSKLYIFIVTLFREYNSNTHYSYCHVEKKQTKFGGSEKVITGVLHEFHLENSTCGHY